MKIYTKVGDKGYTKLGNGLAVCKSSAWIKCYGSIDELNSWIGLICSKEGLADGLISRLREIQNQLFFLGAELCKSHQKHTTLQEDTIKLEHWIDDLTEELTPLKNFILPGGTHTAAMFHIARTVCRRAETELVEAARKENIEYAKHITYMNRLSDLFFCLARYQNNRGKSDILWKV